MTAQIVARDLGPRGSRSGLADADPAGPLPARAAGVLSAVPAWWASRAAEAGLRGRWLDVTEVVEAVMPLVDAPADESITGDTTGEAVGAAYVGGLAPEVRARHGRHYTPPDLAEHLWTMTRTALSFLPRATQLGGLVRDRACGAGALLLPPIREHIRSTARTDAQLALAGLANVVEGIDADPNAAWLANVVLAAEALPLLAAVPASRRRPFAPLVSVGDGLAPVARAALVELQNPPYGRVKLDPAERERWSHILYGHANLYGLFIGAALEGLSDDGVLAALVPTSFTSGLYFSRLRETLADRAPLRSAAFVADRDGVFADVLQETCLAVFTRSRAKWTAITSVNGHVDNVARVRSPRGSAPWLLPRRADDAPTAAVAAALPLRLADLGYRCSTGPLVWNRRTADLTARKERGTLPVIWAADIDGGELHRDTARDALRYLRLRDGDETYMVLSEPAILVQRTTAPEQARRLVVAELTADALAELGGRVVVENHVNVLRPTVEEPLLDRSVLAVVLDSEPIDRVIRSISGSVAVSAYELESVPFPDAETLAGWNDADDLTARVVAAYRRSR